MEFTRENSINDIMGSLVSLVEGKEKDEDKADSKTKTDDGETSESLLHRFFASVNENEKKQQTSDRVTPLEQAATDSADEVDFEAFLENIDDVEGVRSEEHSSEVGFFHNLNNL